MAVQVHVFGIFVKVRHVARAKDPHHMAPIMRDRIFALAPQTPGRKSSPLQP
jgi:hypothetical protein